MLSNRSLQIAGDPARLNKIVVLHCIPRRKLYFCNSSIEFFPYPMCYESSEFCCLFWEPLPTYYLTHFSSRHSYPYLTPCNCNPIHNRRPSQTYAFLYLLSSVGWRIQLIGMKGGDVGDAHRTGMR